MNEMCETCGELMELFGYTYVIKNDKKVKRTFRLCTRHIPYTKVRKTNEEIIE